MLLIYVPKLTNRLGYTLNVIFRHLLHTDFNITTSEEIFLQYDGAKLCYGHNRLGDSVFIKSSGLLFETSIEEQEPRPECRDGRWLLYPVYGRDIDLPFDPLAATFFMVSRYEEYLPHRVDEHGRYFSSQSLASEAGFLELPVVDLWAHEVRIKILERYPDYDIPLHGYRFVQTVDIDAAWCYLHKGLFRTAVGSLRDLLSRHDFVEVARRFRVLAHREADPYDTFDYILDAKERLAPGSTLIFFILLADYDQYDKPASYLNPHFRQLVQHLGDFAKTGIHPGYYSLEHPQQTDVEIKRLADITHRDIKRARFHFLRLGIPMSYRTLLHAGIHSDFTMGYADTVGFRAGISSPYPFYDLERDQETELMIQPFCVMDTTLQKYLRLSPEEGMERYRRLIDSVRSVNGTFCCIVHNQNLCELYGWQGWRATYEQMLRYARP